MRSDANQRSLRCLLQTCMIDESMRFKESELLTRQWSRSHDSCRFRLNSAYEIPVIAVTARTRFLDGYERCSDRIPHSGATLHAPTLSTGCRQGCVVIRGFYKSHDGMNALDYRSRCAVILKA